VWEKIAQLCADPEDAGLIEPTRQRQPDPLGQLNCVAAGAFGKRQPNTRFTR